ncbi:MAG: hypothetical protein KBE04_00585 [Phycisphaerae bacterium]|nr:hypothetical protein [Phycisphaerae bacterium]
MTAYGYGRQGSAYQARTQSDGWQATRKRLLGKRICDLGLRVERSPLEPFIRQLRRELSAKGLDYTPGVYLSDTWGCPDRVPVIGVPFYLASKQLGRLERELTGGLEDTETVMQILRHETGHAINYAFRLWEEPGWSERFGVFSKPYRESFRPKPQSRSFVRHICSSPHGYTYAQKHPDDDFAETFAVWLTPRSGWRRKYRSWPAIRKLRYVDRLMRRIRDQEPKRTRGRLAEPVSRLTMSLAEHYRRLARRCRRTA